MKRWLRAGRGVSGRLRALAVMLLLGVAAVEAWLAAQDTGRGRWVATGTAALLVVAALFVGRPHRSLGLR